ncbi:hypothetical protein SSX86_018148 [Deinandra increscens subsp. villosa]|uniref:valine--tRNA ligase n=1 Tax=Deinandra increscens subsp. villosa TaxID=3103831 RepID=A0AAP0CX82_9ASTR
MIRESSIMVMVQQQQQQRRHMATGGGRSDEEDTRLSHLTVTVCDDDVTDHEGFKALEGSTNVSVERFKASGKTTSIITFKDLELSKLESIIAFFYERPQTPHFDVNFGHDHAVVSTKQDEDEEQASSSPSSSSSDEQRGFFATKVQPGVEPETAGSIEGPFQTGLSDQIEESERVGWNRSVLGVAGICALMELFLNYMIKLEILGAAVGYKFGLGHGLIFFDGAVSYPITPAHDPNDFEVGKRHKLEFINIFTDDGKINSNGDGLRIFVIGVYQGSSCSCMICYIGAYSDHWVVARNEKDAEVEVYLPMIRDAHGRKMSKSLGNVVDPIDVICGIKLEDLIKRLEEGNLDPSEMKVAKEGQTKDFPNGIDQCGADALRFALVSSIILTSPPTKIEPKNMPFSCQWILSVLNKAISKTLSSLEAYEFSDASSAVYSWWQSQLCDNFIEVIKPYFFGDNDESAKGYAQDTLWVCLDTGLRLLHPFMPFVTEELWQRLPSPKNHTREKSIMICKYPSVVEVLTDSDPAPVGCTVAVVNEALSVYLKNQGAIDLKKEREKLNAKSTELQKQKDTLNKAMSAKGYEEKVPAHIKEEENVAKLSSLMQQRLSIEEATQHIESQVAVSLEI